MNAKVAKAGTTNALDSVKLTLAAVLVAAGFAAYYYFSDWSGWGRFGLLAVAVIAALAIASFTALGREARDYVIESRFELRKVVWPTREETMRMTLLVIVVVIILSILLGLIDLMLNWVVLEHLLKLAS